MSGCQGIAMAWPRQNQTHGGDAGAHAGDVWEERQRQLPGQQVSPAAHEAGVRHGTPASAAQRDLQPRWQHTGARCHTGTPPLGMAAHDFERKPAGIASLAWRSTPDAGNSQDCRSMHAAVFAMIEQTHTASLQGAAR